MLGPDDAIELPGDVHLESTVLVDAARGARYPANDTALFVLRRAGVPLGAVAAELASSRRVGLARAQDDVLRFARTLNDALLANVIRDGGRIRWCADWLRLAVRMAPAGMLPPPTARRVSLDTSRPRRAALGAVRALWRRAIGLAAASLLVVAPGRVTPAGVALAIGVGAGVAAHEAGHAALLAGVSASLVLSRFRTFVLHPPLSPSRRSLVALGGPSAAVLLGIGAVIAAWLAGIPELAFGGCAPAAHAVGLTAATADGRAACGL